MRIGKEYWSRFLISDCVLQSYFNGPELSKINHINSSEKRKLDVEISISGNVTPQVVPFGKKRIRRPQIYCLSCAGAAGAYTCGCSHSMVVLWQSNSDNILRPPRFVLKICVHFLVRGERRVVNRCSCHGKSYVTEMTVWELSPWIFYVHWKFSRIFDRHRVNCTHPIHEKEGQFLLLLQIVLRIAVSLLLKNVCEITDLTQVSDATVASHLVRHLSSSLRAKSGFLSSPCSLQLMQISIPISAHCSGSADRQAEWGAPNQEWHTRPSTPAAIISR